MAAKYHVPITRAADLNQHLIVLTCYVCNFFTGRGYRRPSQEYILVSHPNFPLALQTSIITCTTYYCIGVGSTEKAPFEITCCWLKLLQGCDQSTSSRGPSPRLKWLPNIGNNISLRFILSRFCLCTRSISLPFASCFRQFPRQSTSLRG